MPELPGHISLVFILTVLATYIMTVMMLINSSDPVVRKRANFMSILLLLWLIFQSTLALNKWFMDRNAMPPHLAFPLITTIVIICLMLVTKRGREITASLPISLLLWVHIVRFPVELCLYWLAREKQIPWSMTFEGYNYDIIFGITALIIAPFYKKLPAMVIKAWSVLGLISVLAVVTRGIGAAPTPLQAWDFSQPNYAVTYFPFIWLPAFVVPVVIFSHLAILTRKNFHA